MNFARHFGPLSRPVIVATGIAVASLGVAMAQEEAEVIEVVPVEEGTEANNGQNQSATAPAQPEVAASPSHLSAAKAAMRATGASTRLDRILPEIAAFTKAGLINNRPDIEQEISTIVDEVAISMAARRGPLEDEVAKIYVSAFSEIELNEIAAFFTSEAGIKFLNFTPALFKQIDRISGVWRAGITRDLSRQVQQKMSEQGLQ